MFLIHTCLQVMPFKSEDCGYVMAVYLGKSIMYTWTITLLKQEHNEIIFLLNYYIFLLPQNIKRLCFY